MNLIDAVKSGRPWREIGAEDAEGQPLWWSNDEFSEFMRDRSAQDFMRMVTEDVFEIKEPETRIITKKILAEEVIALISEHGERETMTFGIRFGTDPFGFLAKRLGLEP